MSKDLKEGKIDTKFYHGLGVTSALIQKTENEISQSKYTGYNFLARVHIIL